MATSVEDWPPRSPLKALLSSPSGRRRYQEYQDSPHVRCSPNKLLGSPSLLDKLRAARADEDYLLLGQDSVEGEEEDEETLQLQIQAIEAKLKLKKLQKQKANQDDIKRPQSSSSTSILSSRPTSRLEIPVSPTKQQQVKEWTSPSRVRLGIDKGLTAADVSLKRVRTEKDISSRSRIPKLPHNSDRSSRTDVQTAERLYAAKPDIAPKSFSERMAETRNKEKDREEKATAAQSARSLRFEFDRRELEGYRAAKDLQPSILKDNTSVDRSRLTSPRRRAAPEPRASDAVQEKAQVEETRALKHSQSLPCLRAVSPSNRISTDGTHDDDSKGDPSLYEPFSDLDLASRVLPHTFIKRTIPTETYTHLTIPKLLKYVTSPSYSIPDHISDYVVFGIIASKSSPLDHKARRSDTNSVSTKDWEKRWDTGSNNRQKFIVLQLTDLTWTVDLYLFGSAVPRYHRLSQGTVIAILSPAIMPPKKGQEDTGKFSLTLHDGEDQVLEIGTAKYLHYCTAKRKDDSTCGEWVNGKKTSICEYHVNAELEKTRSKRMGINSMGRFGSKKGENSDASTKGWHHESGSYFVVGGRAPNQGKKDNQAHSYAPVYNKNLSTAKLLDATNPNDPFIAEGQMLERDKSDRLRRQMVAQQKERDVIKKLGQLGSGGAGGEYMRHRAGTSSKGNSSTARAGAAATAKAVIMGGDASETNSKKRSAECVSLSPLKKKTRFVTEKGIREAGRESLGPLHQLGVNAHETGRVQLQTANRNNASDDEDDDFDIV